MFIYIYNVLLLVCVSCCCIVLHGHESFTVPPECVWNQHVHLTQNRQSNDRKFEGLPDISGQTDTGARRRVQDHLPIDTNLRGHHPQHQFHFESSSVELLFI